jgi:tetratricopeptide (TPR) repeat protein
LISRAIPRYFAAGNDDKAFDYMDKHFKSFIDDFDELIKMAGLIFEKGYNPQAMTYFNQAKKLQPQNSKLALWLSSRGMQNEAIVLLNEQITKDPKNTEILVDAVKLILRMGKREMAKSYLAKLKEVSPSNTDALKLSGAIAEEEGKLNEAFSIYEEAFKNDPKDLDIIKYLAEIYYKKKMWDKAMIHLRSALNSYPNMPFLLEGLGNLLITCPDPKLVNITEGIEYSERAYINYKSNISVIISAGRNLAKAYSILGDKQRAAIFINQTNSLAKKENLPQNVFQ